MTAPDGRPRGPARAAQWRKPAHPIWRAPETVACRGEDTDLFYRADGELPWARDAREEKAKELCSRCRAGTGCLEAAMEEERRGGARFGIRGGLTPEERRRLQTGRTLRAGREREQEEKETGEAA